MKNLANADAVCFDVDSTVIQEEGIVRIFLDVDI
jgi:phosphoserine phosphatase